MEREKRFHSPRYLILIVLVLSVFSCRETGQQQSNRIICLTPNHTEIVYALDLQDDIVGWTQYCNYPPEVQDVPGWVRYDKYEFTGIEDELKKKVAVVSSFVTVNYTLIDSLKPTLILTSHQMQRGIVKKLRDKGYNVMHFEPVTLDDTFDMMLEIGKATGKAETAEKLVKQYKKEIEVVKASTQNLPKIKVYFEINHMGPYVLGSGSPMDQMIEIAGGVNIFEDVEGEAFHADLKDIVERDPDVILTPLWPAAGREEVTTTYEIVTREGFSNITAVKNSRIYHYDSSLLKRPGPRSLPAIKKLAYLLHPYYFKNPENSVDPWELGKIDENYPPPKALY